MLARPGAPMLMLFQAQQRKERLTWPKRQSRSTMEKMAHIKSVHGVRYQVKDVARAVAFYTQHLGFKLEHQPLPAFANVSLRDAQILLSVPGGRQIQIEDPDANPIELF